MASKKNTVIRLEKLFLQELEPRFMFDGAAVEGILESNVQNYSEESFSNVDSLGNDHDDNIIKSNVVQLNDIDKELISLIKQEVQVLLSSLSSNNVFLESVNSGSLFGDSFDHNRLNELLSMWKELNFELLPEIDYVEFFSPVSNEIEYEIFGAYIEELNVVLLSEQLFNLNDPNLIKFVLLEEYGHYLESEIVQGINFDYDIGHSFSSIVLNNNPKYEPISLNQPLQYSNITYDVKYSSNIPRSPFYQEYWAGGGYFVEDQVLLYEAIELQTDHNEAPFTGGAIDYGFYLGTARY